MNDNLMALAKEYITLDKQRKEKEADAETCKTRMAEIEPVLKDFMVDNDFTFKIKGSTVYKQEQIWPKRKNGYDADDVIDALRDSQWGWLIKDNVNAHKLAAQVREHLEHTDELPAALEKVLDTSPTIKIKVRHS